ncbi:hypothetical protein C5B91_13230 [Haloferax sp. Atlit-10N]|uniref:DUF7857 domain-containing protein n=1 Tax=unclassified Haloferax TaxID=2625095 RepID=UPI000E26A60C|nr:MULTISPECIES: hypothetical protein [unclassified Haloferax]RDZ43089.1 hypothetical protein C5B87_14060 [Haloferax sp. Atlit-16N]RDZ57664.1 hypothetical protein C5B91_13230 [Haloferax sp. Atlit-10N]
MHSDIDVTVDDGVALVSVRVHNDAPVDRRVRLRNRLDGSVLPPRRAGVPEAGWDDDGFEGVVPASSTVALGYAVSPSSTADRDAATDFDARPGCAVDIDVLGRAEGSEQATGSTPEDAVRTLGSARPPADAVPVSSDLPPTTRESETPEPTPSTTSDASDGERREPLPSPASQTHSERPEPSEQPTDADVSAAVGTSEERGRETEQSLGSEPLEPPEPLESLAAFERRIDLAERLDGASVAAAAAALSEADAGVEALESLDSDRERLRRLAARATALADRAADADPDVDALRRLA